MTNSNRPLSSVIIKDLIMQVLKDKEFCEKFTGYNFIDSGGIDYTLFWMLEEKALELGLIEKKY